MKKRKQLINWLFEQSRTVYTRFKKKEAWGVTAIQLLGMPTNSFGHYLGTFLHSNGFELIPKVERHDAYHVLTGFGTAVQDEIALQYLCFGNGKRTPYLLGVLLLGTLLLPEYFSYYKQAYCFGKDSNSFHHFDFKIVLAIPYDSFRSAIFSETTKTGLTHLQHAYSNNIHPIRTI